MSITPVATVTRADAGTSSSIDTTGANFLVAVIAGNSPGISDSKSNTWTQLTARGGSFGMTTAIFYCISPTVGSGHTFTLSGTNPAGVIRAYSSTNLLVFDQEDGTPAVDEIGPTPSGSITPSEDGSLIIAGLGGDAVTATPSIDSGLSLVGGVALSSGVNYSVAMADLVQTTAATISPEWTYSEDFFGSAAVLASFYEDAGGGGATAVPILMYHYMHHLKA